MTVDIGARVREYRERYGLSQAQLGARVGRSREWVSKVENGALVPENYRVLIDLAAVFHCRVADLTGEPLSFAPNGGPGLDLTGLRAALLPYAVLGGLPSGVTLDSDYVEDLGRDATRLRRLRQQAMYSELTAVLPELIRSTEAATRERDEDDERQRAFVALSHVYHVAGAVAQRAGDMELAWIATDRALTAAERGGDDQLVAIAARRVGNALLRSGRPEDAATVSLAAARTLERSAPAMASPEGVSVRGALYLKAAVSMARAGDKTEAWRLLAEAERDVDKVAPDADHAWTAYNGTNVALHRVDVALEQGDPDDALRRADSIDPTAFQPYLAERRSRVFVNVARAYVMRGGEDSAAVSSLLQAESIAPEEVRQQGVVRAMVQTCLRRERKTATPGLRRLAQRVGAGQ
jgi:transcriptional regulator with XRE-family HTH domain